MTIDYSKYPPDWRDIRQQVLEREGHRCKWCNVKNYAYGIRNRYGVFIPDNWRRIDYGDENEPIRIKIVLTIAHLGVPKYPSDLGDKHDTMDCRLINLAALCQRCHLRFDMKDHQAKRAKTLVKKREQKILDSGQTNFFDSVGGER